MTLEDELRHAAKPGHLSREQQDRAAFTSELIKALEAAAQRSAATDPAQLAEAAFNKLHFDFPLVSAEELGSLLERHKAGPGFPLNPKYLAVIREGASAADSTPAGAKAPTDASGSGGSGKSSGGENGAAAAPAVAAAASSGLVPLYQQLYAAVLLKTLQRALSEWDAQACSHFMGQLLPGMALDGGWADGAAGGAMVAGATGWGGLRGGLNGVAETGEASIPQDSTAQQEDSDDMAYEPLEQASPLTTLPNPPAPGSSSSSSGRGLAWQHEAHLLPTLCHLAGQASWHCLNGEGVWREAGLEKELLACLRAARQHECFSELAGGVAQPLLRLLVERVGACPAEVGCFGGVLNALGIAPAGSSISSGISSSGSAAGQPHPEAARLALSTAAMLARQLSTAPAQRKLWQELHGRLLPLAAAQLEEVEKAVAKRAKLAGSTAAGTAAVLLTEHEQYRLMAACQLLYFYVLHAPAAMQQQGGARLAEALLDRGLFRALVLLFTRLAATQEAESLRCAMLLCCAASPSLLQWAAAVPGFKAAALGLGEQQQQEQQAGAEEGALAGQGDEEAAAASQRLLMHGALWRLLLDQGPEASQPLAAMLQAAAASPQQVVHVLGALQLMAAVQQACRPRYPWPAAVEAALRQLSIALKEDSRMARLGQEGAREVQAQPSTGAEDGQPPSDAGGSSSGAAPAANGAAAAGVAEQGEEGSGEGPGENMEAAAQAAGEQAEEEKLRRSAGQQAAALAARRAAQLMPAALKLLKDLLQRQGGAVGKHD